ncbi:MAG: TIR domain-containing protein, partial [Thioalkalivibrio sp.]|nr:TIR domain-containing protein [Thioalkalivibrio sp.]
MSHFSDELWNDLAAAGADLYPDGPRSDYLWKRAGGDPSRLPAERNGRTAWYGALLLLRSGGGGTGISIHSLLATMRDDHAQNPALEGLVKKLTALSPAATDEGPIRFSVGATPSTAEGLDVVEGHPSAIISYTHDSDEHKSRVLALANRLRGDGIACIIDRFEPAPPEGWPLWMTRQITDRDFVLLACTETYERRFSGAEARGRGLGAKWEASLIRQLLYESEGRNEKFIPVVFEKRDLAFVPLELRGGTHHLLPDSYE